MFGFVLLARFAWCCALELIADQLYVIQAPLACVPVRRLSIFFTIKAYTSIILFGGLFIWALVVTKGQGFLLTGSFDDSKVPLGSRSWAMVAGLNAVSGLYSTLEINIPGALAWLEMSWGTSDAD